jgi:hypothetical protein
LKKSPTGPGFQPQSKFKKELAPGARTRLHRVATPEGVAMAAYLMDLRKRVLADCDTGLKTKPVAQKYGVSRTWGRGPKQRLKQLVAAYPDATLVELRDRLGVDCGSTAIWMALAALKITFKKSARGRRAGPTGCRRTPSHVVGTATRA